MTSSTSAQIPVSFQSQGCKLTANLHIPSGFSGDARHPTVVYSPPFNQVKEQTGAVYGRKLAEKGYVVLVFDHLGYGDSEGAIRNWENPGVKMESIRDAISFMSARPHTDRGRLFGLGVCASGGYMALVAATDKRLKAVATVSGMMSNKSFYFGGMDRETVTALIAAQNAGRQKAYETSEVDYVDALGMESVEPGKLPADSARAEGYDFYMTARGGAESHPNYSHKSPSFMHENAMLSDALNYAPCLYTPYIGIYGEKALQDTGPLTVKFHEAASDPKELVEIKGASHVSLYDIDEDVNQAVDAMTAFFEKHGGAS